MNLTSVSPRFFWAHCTPSQADWLKLRSSTLPTSVTRPTRSCLPPGEASVGQPGSGAAAATGWVPATALGLGTTLAAAAELAAGLGAAAGLAAGLAAAAAGLAAGLAAAAVVGLGAAVAGAAAAGAVVGAGWAA